MHDHTLSSVACAHLSTPAGILQIKATDKAVTYIVFVPRPGRDRPNAVTDLALSQLREYFSGKRKTFDLPLSFHGTAFQEAVWRALLTLPYGESVSYQDIARRIGNPKACRAVGSANGKNPISIVIPCHRVMAAGGALGGYTGGLDKKKALLDLEGIPYKSV